jgi:hypothetical protein
VVARLQVDQGVTKPAGDAPNLSTMTVKALKALASERGLGGGSKLKRAELIALLGQ